MAHTFRIILYPGATKICDRLALIAARSNCTRQNLMSYSKLETIFKRGKENNESSSITTDGFKINHSTGRTLLLIQQAEIL